MCCIEGMTCCDADSDCAPDHRCDTERSYCVQEGEESPGGDATPPPSREEMRAGAEGRLNELRVRLSELKTRAPELEVTAFESLITRANEKLSAGDVAEAYRLSVEAGTALDEVRRKLRLAIGELCFEDSECETGNCQNGVCCKVGEVCCSRDAHCREDQHCDTERSYCTSRDNEREGMTPQEHIVDKLTNPETVISLVAAVVLGVGFGLYKLRGRIKERRAEDRFEHIAEQVEHMEQTQHFQAPAGQWQRPPGYKQYPRGQHEWGLPPNQGGP